MQRWTLPVLSAGAMAAGLWYAIDSPPDVLQGNFARIMYVHVPSAWLAFLAFGVTALGSLLWLIRRTPRWDRLAGSSAEVGVLFTAVTLFTGMIWGKPVWGTFWDWGDARMTTTALMLFVYLGYLAMRRFSTDPTDRARRSAILGIIAVVNVPLVYFSVNLWRTLHQTATVRPDGVQMDPEMVRALLANLAAFTILYLALLQGRMRLATKEDSVAVAPHTAGESVVAPRIAGGTGGSHG